MYYGNGEVHTVTGHESIRRGAEGSSTFFFFTWAIDGAVWSTTRQAPAALPTVKRPGTHCTGGWVDPRIGLDGRGKFLFYRHSIPYRPARSESPYRLHYRGPRL